MKEAGHGVRSRNHVGSVPHQTRAVGGTKRLVPSTTGKLYTLKGSRVPFWFRQVPVRSDPATLTNLLYTPSSRKGAAHWPTNSAS